MRKTSVRELHIHTSELVREAEQGGVIVIERRGEPVAELRPITSSAHAGAQEGADLRLHAGNLGPHAASRRQLADDRRGSQSASSVYLDTCYIAKFYFNEPESPGSRARPNR